MQCALLAVSVKLIADGIYKEAAPACNILRQFGCEVGNVFGNAVDAGAVFASHLVRLKTLGFAPQRGPRVLVKCPWDVEKRDSGLSEVGLPRS
eukprot:1900105-Amphidinium_carterae.1